MAARRLTAMRPLAARAIKPIFTRPAFTQTRNISRAEVDDPSITDPTMNGGYVNPPPMKRSLRDPYADWWDKQERRNFGEPVHEDNDILGIFSTEVYSHATPGHAALLFGTFVAATLGLCAVVYQFYPDKPAVPRTFGDGLEVELGGTRALLAKKEGEDQW